MRPLLAPALASALACILVLGPAGAGGAVAATAVPRCLEGPYQLGRVPKHPMTPMHTAKPRNPLEELIVRCTASANRDSTIEED